jgi:hypothetical protein
MAVLLTTMVQVKPDRWEEFLSQTRKGKSLVEGHGGSNVRLLAGLVGGQQTGMIVVTIEFDDFASYGSFEDKWQASVDPELRQLTSSGDASPIAAFQASLWVDVPL